MVYLNVAFAIRNDLTFRKLFRAVSLCSRGLRDRNWLEVKAALRSPRLGGLVLCMIFTASITLMRIATPASLLSNKAKI